MPVLDEDGGEVLLVDELIRVGCGLVLAAQPVLAESLRELCGDAVLLVDVQGPVAVGGQAAPARVRVRAGSV